MELIAYISKKLPSSSIKRILRKLFYNTIFRFPLKDYKFVLLGKVEAKFKKFLFCKIEKPDFELKGYIKNYNIKKGDIVVDAGSFPGEFTIYASKKVGNTGKVISFEPDEYHFKMLFSNIKLNKLNNVIPLNMGLWSKNTKLKDPYGYIKVVSLDSQLERLGIKKVDFIKMDIEGAELEAINGAKETFLNNRVNLAIASYHIVDGKRTYTSIESMLKKLRFKVKTDYPAHLTTYASKK